MRRRTTAVAAVVAAALLPACSQGERQGWADQIRGGADRILGADAATGTITIRVEPRAPRKGSQQPSRVPRAAATDLPLRLEPAAARAAIGGGPGGPTAVFVDGGFFQRRPAAPPPAAPGSPPTPTAPPQAGVAALATNVTALAVPAPAPLTTGTAVGTRGTTGQRPWLAASFRRLDDDDTGRVVGSYALHPVDVVVLLRGVLTGSVRRVGTEDVGGVAATRYTARTGRDKAERGRDERGENLEKAAKAHGATGLVHDLEVWVAADGTPRRVVVGINQEISRDDRGRLTVELDGLSTSSAPAAPIAVPTREETSVLPTFGQLVQAIGGAS